MDIRTRCMCLAAVGAVVLLGVHGGLAQTPDHWHLDHVRKLLARPGNIIGEGTVISADGLPQDGDGRGAAAAADANPDTYWDEVDGQPLYRLAVAFDQPRTIGTIGIAGWGQHAFAPKDFHILMDGRTIHSVKGATYDHNVLLVEIPPTAGSIVELWITGHYGGSPAVRELTLYEAEGVAGADPVRPKTNWEWEEADNSVALKGPAGIVWKLNHGAGLNKVYFDPLGTVDGKTLTWNSPPDHSWHHGLWFSWKVINGINYWEIDRGTGKPPGATRLIKTKSVLNADGSAAVKMQFVYHPAGKPDDIVLDETVSLEIEAPRADGTYRIDWLQETRAHEDVVFDRTPPPGQPGGKGHGGYGGLSFRGAKDLAQTMMMDSSGRRDMDIHRQHSRWMDTSGIIGKDRAGVTFFDHPSNPRHPVPWFVVKNQLKHGPFTYMNPALLCWVPLKLKKEHTVRQFYRVLVHPGPAYPSLLEDEFKRFAAVTPPPPAKGTLYVEPALPLPGASDWSKTHRNVAMPELGALVYASSTYGAGFVAEKAIDGKWLLPEEDKWMASANQPPHYLRLDLGQVRTVDRVRIVHEGLQKTGTPNTTCDFRIQSSLRPWGPWKDVIDPVHDNKLAVTEHLFAPTKARYVRLLIETAEQNGNNTHGRIFEFQVFAPR
jgi:hypothetical protein